MKKFCEVKEKIVTQTFKVLEHFLMAEKINKGNLTMT